MEERVACLQANASDAAMATTTTEKLDSIPNGVDHSTLTTSSQGGMWEDVKELLVLEKGNSNCERVFIIYINNGLHVKPTDNFTRPCGKTWNCSKSVHQANLPR